MVKRQFTSQVKPPLCDLAQAEEARAPIGRMCTLSDPPMLLRRIVPFRFPANIRTLVPSLVAHLPHDTLEAVLEPLDGLLLGDAVGGADAGLAPPALSDTLAGAGPGSHVSPASSRC